MEDKSRILIGISAVMMISVYFLPLWQIFLEAPQYPEGLELKIWLNGITGNVDQINGLNHYIGMKHIIVSDFVEFRILPYVFAFLIATGLVSAITSSKKLLYGWLGMLILFAIIGFADFYLWEYNYGHNLDPRAAIKIEGMSYQPPLLGYKQLLNFLAGSFPAAGGIIVGIAGVLVAWVAFFEYRLSKAIK